MKPIGLKLKNYKVNPFTNRGSGELMIVHQCLCCGKISTNRIAGDDNEYQLLSILEESLNLGTDVTRRLESIGIKLLTEKDKKEILIALFGYNYKKYLNY